MCSSFSWASSLISVNSSSLHKKFLSSFTAASVGTRGSYNEVKSHMLFDALWRVLPNPTDALALLVFSKWPITMTTTSTMSLKKKHWKVDSAVSKNIWNRSKCIYKPIFEVARWDHIVHKEICSRSILRKTVRILVVVWKDNERLWKIFAAFRGAASWDLGRHWTATGETSLGPNSDGLSWCTMPGVSVYHESPWSMSNRKRLLIRSVQICQLAAGWFVVLWGQRIEFLSLAFVECRDPLVTLVLCMKWWVD